MKIISDSRVNNAIKKFVGKNFVFYGQKFDTIAEKDRVFMEQFLNRFYCAFRTLFRHKHVASDIFIDRLLLIDAVRFDDADKDIMPFKVAFEEMERYCGENLEGGIFMPTKSNGVLLLDMDTVSHSKPEWLHTLIHELIHAMVMIEKEQHGDVFYQTGIAKYGRSFFKLNEGFTEIIAQLMWAKMYKNKHCPGVGRYANEVAAAEFVMSKVMAKENFIEWFIFDSNIIVDELQNVVNEDGESLFDVISKFNKAKLTSACSQKRFLNEMNKFKTIDCEENLVL